MLQPPHIGPIVGHTTAHAVRIMTGIESSILHKPNIGRIRYRTHDTEWCEPKKFRFNKTFYFTGVIELTGLAPNKEYIYQVAIISDTDEDTISDDDDWGDIEEYVFKTRAADPNPTTSFCFGSCLRNNNDARWGKTLRSVTKLNNLEHVDFMLWLGDQIYNDEYMWLTPNNTEKEDFAERYEAFFHNEYVKPTISLVSNYMIIDDHEIENSFTEGAKAYASGGLPFISKNKERLMNGMTAIYSYQMSHGPIFDTQPDAAQAGVSFVKGQGNHQTPANHFASTKINDVGLFLTDTRKDRTKTLLMSREQEEKLKAFLSDNTTRAKLVASSVTFLGDRGKKPKKADNWMRAYKQRKRILKHIVTHDIKNVVFLSGDIHSHYATQFCVNGEKLPVYQLVSGSLFWPTSFLIDKIRWTRRKTRWGHVHGSPSSYSITEPLSLTHYDFFEGNGIGHVLIEGNQLTFKVFNHEHKVVIETELGLE